MKQGPQSQTLAGKAVTAAREASQAGTGSFVAANSQNAWLHSITNKTLSKEAKKKKKNNLLARLSCGILLLKWYFHLQRNKNRPRFTKHICGLHLNHEQPVLTWHFKQGAGFCHVRVLKPLWYRTVRLESQGVFWPPVTSQGALMEMRGSGRDKELVGTFQVGLSTGRAGGEWGRGERSCKCVRNRTLVLSFSTPLPLAGPQFPPL